MENMSEIKQETAVVEQSTATTATEQSAPVVEKVETVDILSMVSEDLKGVKSLEKFRGKDINELAKSYANLEGLIGKKVSELPADVVKQFLNVPTAPEGYVISDDAKALVNEKILKKASELNISQDQMKSLSDLLVEIDRSAKAEESTKAELTMAERRQQLEKEFGSALQERMKSVDKVLTQYGDTELKSKMTQAGLLHDVEFVKFLDKITQDVLKVKLVGGDYVAQTVLTPEEALKEISVRKADKAFMAKYLDYKDPGHELAVQEWQNLFNLAYGK